jgi:FAD/FMN-containing dehydrogenase
VPHKFDVTLPMMHLGEFVAAVPGVVEATVPGARTWLFGHVGDGNVHVNVTGAPPDAPDLDDAVYRAVVDLGGSISAEHGIGTAKVRYLAMQRSPAELAAMRAIKSVLDPDRILNPHTLIP